MVSLLHKKYSLLYFAQKRKQFLKCSQDYFGLKEKVGKEVLQLQVREKATETKCVHFDLENCLKRKKSLNAVEFFKAGSQFFISIPCM